MEIEIRPLSTGEILDRTFRLYRAQFGLFVGIATVAALMETAGNAVEILGFRYAQMLKMNNLLVNAAVGVGSLLQMLLVLVAASVVFAAVARAVMELHQGRRMGIASAYQAVLPRWFRYVRLAVCWWFLSGWPFILVFLLLAIPIGMLGGHVVTAESPKFIGAVVAWVVMLLFSVPVCIWLFCRYSLCMAASAIEDLGAYRSLKRSVMLSKGFRWRIFLLLLVVYVLQSILATGLMVPILGFFLNLPKTHGVLPLGAAIYEIAIGLVMIAVITPIYTVGLTLIYIDTRIRKEGYDIELMMQRTAGGMTAPSAAPQPGDSAPLATG